MGAISPQAERMRAQGYTEEEIEDMLKCDREIDRGADLFPLAPELEQGAKKARRADRTDTPKKTERTRAEDDDKRYLIKTIACNLCDDDDPRWGGVVDLEVTNHERQIDFVFNGRKMRIVLSAPRN
jgi:hypothetical protein